MKKFLKFGVKVAFIVFVTLLLLGLGVTKIIAYIGNLIT